MDEQEDVGEQLSEEEIVAQIQELLVALEPYNNLSASVLHNQHYSTEMFESDPSLTEGDDENGQYYRDLAQKWKRFSNELREEMANANVGLEPEDGYAYRDIMTRSERRMVDLIFLREYLPKMEALYKRLHYKNGVDGDIRWDQQTLGTFLEE